MASSNNTRSTNRRYIKRPDEKELKMEIDQLKNEIKQLDLNHNEINNEISKYVIDSKINERRKELQAEIKILINKQAGIKTERSNLNNQIKNIDQEIKRRISEIQAQTSKNNFKNVQEIDAKIDEYNKSIESGSLKLAEEKQLIKEISALRKLRKDFALIEKQQESIDEDKAKISELRKKLSSVNNKEVQEQFEKIQKELEDINTKNKSLFDKRAALFNKRNEIWKSKDEKYERIRALRAEFDAEFGKFKKAIVEEKKKREEEAKQKIIEDKKQKLKELAEKQLADASIPAFTKEINLIHNLLSYFDPNYVKPHKNNLNLNGKLPENKNIRKIEMPDDVVVIKKEQEDFFAGSRAKKFRQRRNRLKSFTTDPDIITSLSDLNIPLPTSYEDFSATIKYLKDILNSLETKQEEQTKINIEKAKEKIGKLDLEKEIAEDNTKIYKDILKAT